VRRRGFASEERLGCRVARPRRTRFDGGVEAVRLRGGAARRLGEPERLREFGVAACGRGHAVAEDARTGVVRRRCRGGEEIKGRDGCSLPRRIKPGAGERRAAGGPADRSPRPRCSGGGSLFPPLTACEVGTALCFFACDRPGSLTCGESRLSRQQTRFFVDCEIRADLRSVRVVFHGSCHLRSGRGSGVSGCDQYIMMLACIAARYEYC
jgi:hypothetical protein